jgi:16S rRNA pseudouridine516 synthase
MENKTKKERLDKLLSNLGYGVRKDVRYWVNDGLITIDGKSAASVSQKVTPDQVHLEGKPLDHPYGLTVIYHKPVGAVCSRKEDGRLIFDDFPERWISRKPPLSCVGRLDKNTSGLLILTDNGQLNHRITSPRQHISKTYTVTLDCPLQNHDVSMFASGKLMLENDDRPCLPAELTITGDCHASLVLHEGRYHQVRRMFTAAGNHVTALTRTHIGALALAATKLQAGAYTTVTATELMEMIGLSQCGKI